MYIVSYVPSSKSQKYSPLTKTASKQDVVPMYAFEEKSILLAQVAFSLLHVCSILVLIV